MAAQMPSSVHADRLFPSHAVAAWRDRLATGLMSVSALGAFVSFVDGIAVTRAAEPGTQVVEAWRTLGFFVFTGLCVLCAMRPRQVPGAWELVILHKAGIALVALMLLGGARDAGTVVAIDGAMALMVTVAYILSRGDTSWAALRTRH
jgi:hypothetical protein